MLKIRNRADSTATPQLPLSWDDNAQPPATASPTRPGPAEATASASPPLPPPPPPPSPADDVDLDQTSRPAALPVDDGNDSLEMTPESDGAQPSAPLPDVVHLDEITEKLGLQLLSLRARVGVSAAEVAAKVHAGVACINDLEQGNYDRLPPDFFCKSLIERLCQEYDVDPGPLLELFEKESLAAGRTPSGFMETVVSADGTGPGKPRRDPLSILTSRGIDGDDAGGEEKSPHHVIGLVLGLIVAAFVILLGAAIVHQFFLKRNPPPQQPAKTDLSVLITPHRPAPEVLRIN